MKLKHKIRAREWHKANVEDHDRNETTTTTSNKACMPVFRSAVRDLGAS